MKKRTVIALIVAAVLILTGGLILLLGLSYAGSNEDPVTMLVESEFTVPEDFDSVLIDTEDCNVNFVLFNGAADPHVVIQERERTSHSVLVEDGVLKIRMMDNRRWQDFIGVNWESMEMTVYLPQKQYESVRITTATGDVKISKVLSAREMVLRSDTGAIWCEGAAAELLDCMTSTGDISVRGGAPVTTKLQSNTGDLDMSGSEGKEIHMTTDTGDVDAENVTAETFTCSSDTGEVELEQVIAADYLQIRTTTGDVGIESCDAGKVNIETDTGDVTGHFLTPKYPSAHSNTGTVKVPNTPEGGDCRIESNTGDIHFE